MLLKTAFLSFILLICPWALCYGQLSFLGVNGERGYSAVRGTYRWDLDNNFIFTPSYEFYRMSDNKEVEETGSTYRYGLKGSYDFSDAWQIYGQFYWQPRAVGNRACSGYGGVVWRPFYRKGWVKNPFLETRLGTVRYKTWVDKNGAALTQPFGETEYNLLLRAGAEAGPWDLKASWHKVLQYKNQVPPTLSFNWADIPFMTAVVQGFLQNATALHISYPTRLVTPFVSAARYQYAASARPATAVGAGLHIHYAETTFSGGVEVFEPRREDNRKTFFSVSVEVDF